MTYQDEFWTSYFKYYDVLLELLPYQNLMKQLVDSLDISTSERIVDIGCGTANILSFTSFSEQFIGFDQSTEALAKAKTKFPFLKTYKGSITEALPFKSNEFDKIVTNNVLYTIPKSQWPTVISECKRILKPGGTIVISNLKSTFDPVEIYKTHVKTQARNYGLVKTGYSILKLLIPTIQIFRYNRIISKSNNNGSYHFVDHNEQTDMFVSQGFTKARESQHVYANQAILDVFTLE